MAERRMFARKIIDSDAFLDMPISARLLYYDLGMRADDDGFVGNPRRIANTIGAQIDDLKILISKRFVIAFDNGIIVIKHWRMSNALRKDRYEPTVYQEQAKMLGIKSNGSYTELPNMAKNEGISYDNHLATIWQPTGNPRLPQVRLGKVRLGKVSIGQDKKEKEGVKPPSKFVSPTEEEVMQYTIINKIFIDAKAFHAYYESNGWKVGRNKMVNWHGAVATWLRKEIEYGRGNTWTDDQLDYIQAHPDWVRTIDAHNGYEEKLV